MNTTVSEHPPLQYSALLYLNRGVRQLSVSFRLKKCVLACGDIILLNLALFLALTLRQFALPDSPDLSRHLLVFNMLHGSWLLIFYGMGLYDIHLFAVPKTIERKLVQAIGIAAIVTIVFFYAFRFVSIEPKTVLLLDLTFSGLFLLGWRKWFTRWNRSGSVARILLCGRKSESEQLEAFYGQNSYLGYQIARPLLLWEESDGTPAAMILQRLQHDRVDILAITRALTEDSQSRGLYYQLLCGGVPVVEFSSLAEEFTGKIPVSAIDESWFLANLREFNKLGFEIFKRGVDIAAALGLGVIALCLFPLIAAAIKLDSPGGIFFRQTRTGRSGRQFSLVKYRTMREDAEKEGPRWATEKDNRITRVGAFLRRTRLDELPQLWNVLKGEMSLIGPRPERPEFVDRLARDIPFYEARHLVKPGLTGWAQTNFGYGASVEDAMEKLQHDLYYIKNRCVSLEVSILLKTIGTVLRYEGR